MSRFEDSETASALTALLFASRYYSGEKKAPILTVFIGGNHEASNHLQELPYGGWVAPNIYYLGMSEWTEVQPFTGAFLYFSCTPLYMKVGHTATDVNYYL